MSLSLDPVLSIVLPSRDGATRLGETLESIAAQETDGAVEVIVVDDGSLDGTSDAARTASLPWGSAVVVRHPAPRGRSAACNSGIEAARAPLVLILDDDMTIEAGGLEAHRRFHIAGSGLAAIGRVVQTDPERDSCFERFLLREEVNREKLLLESRQDVPFHLCLTGHFSAPRKLLVEAGGFDTRITRYGLEDIELAYRLTRRGARIEYLPEAVAHHRAYMRDLDRYLQRHLDVGVAARQLAEQYAEGPFRDYLRVDGPRSLGVGRDPTGLVALRLSNRLLLISPFRKALGSHPGMAALRGALRAAERLHMDRIAHFGYHVARDVRYFQGYFEAAHGA